MASKHPEPPAARIDRARIRKFADSLKGDLILPDHPQYPHARRVWNHAVNLRPAMIARCLDRQDVVRAVDFARRNAMLTAVRSGGHSFAGHGVCEGGMVIDLSRMKRVAIDPNRKTVTIEPGVIGSELDYVVQGFRMAVPLGSCPAVGVAGYSLGGGESSLTPKFGFGCDSITRAEVVTADGEVLDASDRGHRDLFWAMRGAGANFGVATAIEFALHPIEHVLGGHLRYPIRQARKVLRFLNDYAETVPNDLYLLAAVLPHPGERMLDVAVLWPGDERVGERLFRPLRKFLKPFEDSIQHKEYLDEQRGGSDSPGDGDWSSHRRGGHFHRLGEPIIDAITEFMGNSPSEASGITMPYWHGRWASGAHDNAFGFRRVGYEYWIHSYWQRQSERDKSWEWVERFFAAMSPLSTGAVYVNDLENESDARVRAAYGDHYQRLTRLKRKFDPDNFFRVNQNIKPAR